MVKILFSGFNNIQIVMSFRILNNVTVFIPSRVNLNYEIDLLQIEMILFHIIHVYASHKIIISIILVIPKKFTIFFFIIINMLCCDWCI